MPRLILFVPCEKPLVGADSMLSLINVLQSITVVPTDADEAKGTGLPIGTTTWHIVTVWQREPGDDAEGVRFQQRVTMTGPDGKVLLQTLGEFAMPKPYHRNLGRIEGFPVLPEGEYTLTASVRNANDSEWTEKGTYPIRINSNRVLEQKPTTPSSKTTTH